MAALDHVIRIEREGTATRWVQTIARSDEMGCTVTWHIGQARRMTEANAQRQAARLQELLGKTLGTLSATPIEEASSCPA